MAISCKLPTTTIGGGKAAVTSVIVRRDNTVVAEITEGVADGKTFSWTDTETATDGEHMCVAPPMLPVWAKMLHAPPGGALTVPAVL